MKNFGQVIRELRIAQALGLRETAYMLGISPAYLSRIERGKEKPPSPEVIKSLAKALAADADVLFRLAVSTDPEITDFLRKNPVATNLFRFLIEERFTCEEISSLLEAAKTVRGCISTPESTYVST